ncbi:hypothetical protein [Mycoplasmopsis lipofaciens]|uniref:hypothetical protein n=1 Tax=Mycoplasmopsis lipofaciens TaxID=114884 RepID=UPI000488467A|nr:hypothetical protein [Mycoplasmopsis lipofaciens]
MKKNKKIFTLALATSTIAPVALVASCNFQKEKPKKPMINVEPKTNGSIEYQAVNELKAQVHEDFNRIDISILSPEKQTEIQEVIKQYADSIATQLGKIENTALMNIRIMVSSKEDQEKIARSYNKVALKLNSVLAGIMDSAIKSYAENNTINNGLAFVKSELNGRKLTEIKNELIEIYEKNKDSALIISNSSFDSLRDNDITKNIPILDTFINEMKAHYVAAVNEIGQKAREIELSDVENTGHKAVLNKFKELLVTFKNDAVAKARSILTNKDDYNAVRSVLKSKYISLEQSVSESIELLLKKTQELATLLDDHFKA